ncbi:collagen and calcium-binding EGF domain-containing protein 1-like [Diachasmimorpha longicaudata]|uniref:collagen and calcium-binding EGF domain-containing protein 1-like n=1 Tax=Diachasmimorpha longicaudata TaxID=58733 RepID=UPI0030B908F3
MYTRVWTTISTLVIAGAILQVMEVADGNQELNQCIGNLRLNRCLNQCVQQYGQDLLGGSYLGSQVTPPAPTGYTGGTGGTGGVGGVGGTGRPGPNGPWPTGSSGRGGPYPGDPGYVAP